MELPEELSMSRSLGTNLAEEATQLQLAAKQMDRSKKAHEGIVLPVPRGDVLVPNQARSGPFEGTTSDL